MTAHKPVNGWTHNLRADHATDCGLLLLSHPNPLTSDYPDNPFSSADFQRSHTAVDCPSSLDHMNTRRATPKTPTDAYLSDGLYPGDLLKDVSGLPATVCHVLSTRPIGARHYSRITTAGPPRTHRLRNDLNEVSDLIPWRPLNPPQDRYPV